MHVEVVRENPFTKALFLQQGQCHLKNICYKLLPEKDCKSNFCSLNFSFLLLLSAKTNRKNALKIPNNHRIALRTLRTRFAIKGNHPGAIVPSVPGVTVFGR